MTPYTRFWFFRFKLAKWVRAIATWIEPPQYKAAIANPRLAQVAALTEEMVNNPTEPVSEILRYTVEWQDRTGMWQLTLPTHLYSHYEDAMQEWQKHGSDPVLAGMPFRITTWRFATTT